MSEKKYSRKRQAIYDMLCSTKEHPSAEWVYGKLKQDIPDLSLATVYRNIALFVSEGSAQRISTVDGIERFDGNALPHTHFICEKCGSVYDIDMECPKLDGYYVKSAILHGRCKACIEKENIEVHI